MLPKAIDSDASVPSSLFLRGVRWNCSRAERYLRARRRGPLATLIPLHLQLHGRERRALTDGLQHHTIRLLLRAGGPPSSAPAPSRPGAACHHHVIVTSSSRHRHHHHGATSRQHHRHIIPMSPSSPPPRQRHSLRLHHHRRDICCGTIASPSTVAARAR